ncbi:MAG: WbqC family protein [Pontiellaceae bacterium]|jgi:hypothetical protein|nr:WbqC family protein [Pontiellaceae bacterium]
MKLGIMQPYFFPYLGHFDLINRADEWIVFDTAQYMRHQWVNRNRILHPNAGWQYVTIPLKKHTRETLINRIEAAENSDWRGRILRQLQHYRKSAPFYAEVTGFLEECFAVEGGNLTELNAVMLERTCRHLGIATPFHILSRMDLVLEGPIEEPGDWALRIAYAFGADEYVNAAGGAELFDAAKFAAHGIALFIQSYTHMTYPCGPFRFEPGLSIIDVMMWNSPEAIRAHLDSLRGSAGERRVGVAP